MPAFKAVAFVFASAGLVRLKEEGPEILVQCHLTIVPSGSEDELPSSSTLSTGSLTCWSDPAKAMGGLLLVVLQFSQESSGRQLLNSKAVKITDRTFRVECIDDRWLLF